MESLRQAIEDAGGVPAVAARLGTSPPRVYNWLRRGRVPPGEIVRVCRATHWRVTPHQLSPRVYPHPCDGIPAEPDADSEGGAAN